MIYAVILAGGTGSRMGVSDVPKQFLEIKGKPILCHTLEKFLPNPRFEKIIVLSPRTWLNQTKALIKKHCGGSDRVAVIEGGATRNETIMNAVAYIETSFGLDDDTVIVTHDSVRPFVTHRIIEENIESAIRDGACDTVIPATDTIVEGDGDKIVSIPDRRRMYQGQTPQSFRAKALRDAYLSLSSEEKEILTDAAKILVIKGQRVALVRGETYNIKITYPYDLRIARSLLEDDTDD
jgi:2-C-methyl-D-erythritol 4-phosphate cytidylyltransferase